jgi:hypothetical protein
MAGPSRHLTADEFAARASWITARNSRTLLYVALAVTAAGNLPAIMFYMGSTPRPFVKAQVVLWGVFALVHVARRMAAGREIHTLQLVCPECREELAGGGRRWFGTHAEVLEKGRCPACGVQLFPPADLATRFRYDAVGRMPRMFGWVILVTGVASSVVVNINATRSFRFHSCQVRYDRALTAADSARIGASRPGHARDVPTCARIMAGDRTMLRIWK